MSTSEDKIIEFEERAAIKEFDGNLPRPEAERQAALEVFGSTEARNKAIEKLRLEFPEK